MKQKQGLVGILTLIVTGILLLAYFHVDIRSIYARPEVTKVVTFFSVHGKIILDSYLKKILRLS